MMPSIHYQYTVDGEDFTMAGEASSSLKQTLKMMNLNPDVIRRCAICMYEGEINMVIHAEGGTAELDVDEEKIVCEMATGVYRAGACVYLTYFAKEIAGYIEKVYIG